MKLEIYFDYLCEFCLAAYRGWDAVLAKYPWIEPVWMPCEAHPREEEPGYGFHSDLAIQGMFYLSEHGLDAAGYNRSLFEAFWKRREDPEDLDLLARYAGAAGADPEAFKRAVQDGGYLPALREANRRAWVELSLPAVPSYRLEDGSRLDAALGVGVPQERLERFLQAAAPQK